MASTARTLTTEQELGAEIADLRQNLLQLLLPVSLGLTWFWFMYVMARSFPIGLNQLPLLILPSSVWLAYRLATRFHTAACWALLLGAVASLSAIVAAHPDASTLAFGVVIIVLANAILGPYQALAAAGVMWLAGTAARALVGTPMGLPAGTVEALILYLLAWAAVWLESRALRTSVQLALAGWQQAHEALAETRQRRAELYRVVRSMDEASYRIEHMNNELIAARREAETQRALKARFVATVSHELRGPLNLILGFSRLMVLSPELYGGPLPEAYRADADAIYRNSQHLVTLIDDILDLSQIEAERLPLIRDRVNLAEDVIDKAVKTVQPLAERKGLTVQVAVPLRLPWILADPIRLRQALLNLLTNAVRFTERGGIAIRAVLDGGQIAVSVQDTGIGVAPEDLPKLFHEFYQLRPGERRGPGGSGLGLHITKQLIELHGGRIWAESAPGAGTTFHFTLPLPGADHLAGELTRTAESPSAHSTAAVCLVVHDDPAVVRALARCLDDCRLVGLPDIAEIATLSGKLHPQAIIAPPEAVAQIQERLAAERLDVPIIACRLPYALEGNRNEGILSYLVKPIATEALAAIVRGVERGSETTVLIVDDEPDAVRLLELLLVLIPRPYRILKAYSGLEALERMAQVVPDIMLIDLVMPELSGWETIARMRADERLRAVPVVILSAQDMSEQGLVVPLPLAVYRQKPLELARAAKALRALLETISPDYLPGAGLP